MLLGGLLLGVVLRVVSKLRVGGGGAAGSPCAAAGSLAAAAGPQMK